MTLFKELKVEMLAKAKMFEEKRKLKDLEDLIKEKVEEEVESRLRERLRRIAVKGSNWKTREEQSNENNEEVVCYICQCKGHMPLK